MIKQHFITIPLAASALVISQSVFAASFMVRDIEVNGLERIAAGTVLSYLPARVGEKFDDGQSADAIRSLYQTGLFDDVQLSRRGDVLIVSVVERPAIGEVNITGNRRINTEQLMKALKLANVSKGDTLNKSALLRIQSELKEQYLAQGNYAVDVNTTIEPLPRNRVAVNIDVKEGNAARIKQVRILGNKAFPEAVLLKQMKSGTKSSWSIPIFSSRDKYAKEKLSGDLDKLNAFYRDRGYLNFEVVSTQVQLTPDDKEGVFVTININEGDQYRISKVNLVGDTQVPRDELLRLITIKPGEVFSQKKLEETRKGMSSKLGASGFAFGKIGALPEFDEVNKRVAITLAVEPGKRTYVRRINIRGHDRTKDEVYRREMRQLESSWFSKEKVERSKVRIQRLPYVEDVTITTEPVAGARDQVDLNVEITERSSNQFRVGAGYSQSAGFLFNVSLKQENFMGTGKQLDVNFDNSKSTKRYRVSYTNPYYTPDGISRGFSLYYNEFDAAEEDITDYASNTLGGRIHYTVPLSETDSFHVGVGAEQREIVLGTSPATEVSNFVTKHGNEYTQLPLTLSYVRDTRDRTIFPTKGQSHRVSLESALPGSDLEYNKVSYKGSFYKSLNDNLTFVAKGKLGIGDGSGDVDELPFFEKFYAGGIGSVRGFERSSLGPRDSNNDPFGGDAMVAATAEVQFPMPLAQDVKGLKMSAFVDVGNVYKDVSSFEADELRYSAGIGAVWLSPIGPLELSYAKPLNAKAGDDEQELQFSIGASF